MGTERARGTGMGIPGRAGWVRSQRGSGPQGAVVGRCSYQGSTERRSPLDCLDWDRLRKGGANHRRAVTWMVGWRGGGGSGGSAGRYATLEQQLRESWLRRGSGAQEMGGRRQPPGKSGSEGGPGAHGVKVASGWRKRWREVCPEKR